MIMAIITMLMMVVIVMMAGIQGFAINILSVMTYMTITMRNQQHDANDCHKAYFPVLWLLLHHVWAVCKRSSGNNNNTALHGISLLLRHVSRCLPLSRLTLSAFASFSLSAFVSSFSFFFFFVLFSC